MPRRVYIWNEKTQHFDEDTTVEHVAYEDIVKVQDQMQKAEERKQKEQEDRAHPGQYL